MAPRRALQNILEHKKWGLFSKLAPLVKVGNSPQAPLAQPPLFHNTPDRPTDKNRHSFCTNIRVAASATLGDAANNKNDNNYEEGDIQYKPKWARIVLLCSRRSHSWLGLAPRDNTAPIFPVPPLPKEDHNRPIIASANASDIRYTWNKQQKTKDFATPRCETHEWLKLLLRFQPKFAER